MKELLLLTTKEINVSGSAFLGSYFNARYDLCITIFFMVLNFVFKISLNNTQGFNYNFYYSKDFDYVFGSCGTPLRGVDNGVLHLA